MTEILHLCLKQEAPGVTVSDFLGQIFVYWFSEREDSGLLQWCRLAAWMFERKRCVFISWLNVKVSTFSLQISNRISFFCFLYFSFFFRFWKCQIIKMMVKGLKGTLWKQMLHLNKLNITLNVMFPNIKQ